MFAMDFSKAFDFATHKLLAGWIAVLGPVQTNTDCFETAIFFTLIRLEGALNHSGKCSFGEWINWFVWTEGRFV